MKNTNYIKAILTTATLVTGLFIASTVQAAIYTVEGAVKIKLINDSQAPLLLTYFKITGEDAESQYAMYVDPNNARKVTNLVKVTPNTPMALPSGKTLQLFYIGPYGSVDRQQQFAITGLDGTTLYISNNTGSGGDTHYHYDVTPLRSLKQETQMLGYWEAYSIQGKKGTIVHGTNVMDISANQIGNNPQQQAIPSCVPTVATQPGQTCTITNGYCPATNIIGLYQASNKITNTLANLCVSSYYSASTKENQLTYYITVKIYPNSSWQQPMSGS